MSIGQIVGFASTVAPEGYLPCDGSSYSQSEYPELYAMIGNQFGGPAGFFNVPDLRGQFLRGADMSSQFPGMFQGDSTAMPNNRFRASGTTSSAGSHNHSGNTNVDGVHSHSYQTPSGSTVQYGDRNSQALDRGTSTRSTGSAGAHSHAFTTNTAGNHSHNLNISVTGGDAETRPMNMGVLYCICAKAPEAAPEAPGGFYAQARVNSTGAFFSRRGIASCGVVTTGTYRYEFEEPMANTNYTVLADINTNQSGIEAKVVSFDVNGFEVYVGKSNTKPVAKAHSVIVVR